MIETQTSQPSVPTRYKTLRRPNKTLHSAPAAVHQMPISANKQSPSALSTPSHHSSVINDPLTRTRSRYRRRPTVDTSFVASPSTHNSMVILPPKERISVQSQAPPAQLQQKPAINSWSPPSSPAASPVSPLPSKVAPTSVSLLAGTFQPEKKINIEVGKEVLSLPASLDTEASTLAIAASKLVPGKTISNAAVLLESFKGLGLERPIRKYERVRDIVSGWEDDTRNTLVLITSLSGGEGLNVTDAPTEPPEETAAWLYHSNKAGKWSKRWIVLREDGGLMLAKKESKKDKDFQLICRMSDFDVYSPSATTIANTLRCPKRYCFSLKSQQKPSLFQSTADWVHYFATDDKALASAWQNLLKSWRSFYLVQMKGLGKQEDKETGDEQEKGIPKPDTSGLSSPKSGSRPPTADASNSPGGKKKFTPLISPEELTKPPPKPTSLLRSKSHKVSGRHGEISDAPPIPALDGDVFASSGLLGRTYSLKVKELQDKEQEQKRRDFGPITYGGQAVGQGTISHKRYSSVDSATGFDFSKIESASKPPNTTTLQRHKTTIAKPKQKPLLDFEREQVNVSQPPPQHQQRGRSRTLTAAAGVQPGGLIASVPSFNDAPPLPAAGPFTKSRSRPPTRNRADEEEYRRRADLAANPFTGTGLLAGVGESAGASNFGHGVAAFKDLMGNHGQVKPLLDTRDRSMFAEGSLLAKIERDQRQDPANDRKLESSDSD